MSWTPIRLSTVVAALLLAAPLGTTAQPAAKVHRIGYLASSDAPLVDVFRQQLGELGYVEGQNLRIERYAAGRVERLPGVARELVQLRVDVIVAVGSAAVQAARDVTSSLPIVIFTGADPVAQGWVASLARPGGNITGVVIGPETRLVDKRLQLLKEAVPRATRVAVLASAEPGNRHQVQAAQGSASSLKVTLVVVEVRGDYERAFGKMIADQAQALVVLASPILNRDRKSIIDLAAKHRLPAIYQWRTHADEGGLMAYGTNSAEIYRRMAAQVDRIFKGTKPADLPVEQPTTFELVINLKTAKALGLTIPPSLLVQAGQVIE